MPKITYTSTSERIEQGVLKHLRYGGSFKGCELITHGLALQVPEKLPIAIVHCNNVSSHEGFQTAIRSFRASVDITLYGDSEQMTKAKFQQYAREIERKVFADDNLRQWFNEDGGNAGTIRGLYLHEYDDWSTSSTMEGATWSFRANMGLIFQSTS